MCAYHTRQLLWLSLVKSMTKKCLTGWWVNSLIQVLSCILSSYLLVTSFKEITTTQLCMLEICVWTTRTLLQHVCSKTGLTFTRLILNTRLLQKTSKALQHQTFCLQWRTARMSETSVVLVARVLVDHLNPLKSCVQCHVVHKYFSEMSKKSEVVFH